MWHQIVKLYIALFALCCALFLFVDVTTVMAFLGVSFNSIVGMLVILHLSLAMYGLLDAMQYDKDILSFRGVLHGIFLSYALVTPIGFLIYSYDFRQYGNIFATFFEQDRFIKVMMLMALYQVGMIIGSKLRPLQFSVLRTVFSTSRITPISWIILVLALSPWLMLILEGQWGIDKSYGEVFEAVALQRETNPLTTYLGLQTFPPIIWIALYSYKRKQMKWLVILFAFLILITMFKPSRGLIVGAMIAAILCRHYYYKRLSLGKVALFVIIAIVLSMTLMSVRLGDQRDVELSDIAMSSSEGGVIFQNTYLVHKYIEDTGDYRYGIGYLKGYQFLVPKWMLPFERDPNMPLWLLQTFFGPSYPGGRMFSIVADGYLNFSYPGPLILGILTAYIMKIFYTHMRTESSDPRSIELGTILYLVFCVQIYLLYRSDVVYFIVNIYAQLVVTVGVILVFAMRRRVFTRNAIAN